MYPSLDLKGVLRLSDIVVEGRIERAASTVTSNQEFVATTYEFHVDRVLFNRQPAARTPGGPISTLQFVHPGGDVMFDGRLVRAADTTLPPFAVGSRLVLFLKRDGAAPGVLTIVSGPYGAFGVENGRIKSFARADTTVTEQFDGKDLSRFETVVQETVSTLR